MTAALGKGIRWQRGEKGENGLGGGQIWREKGVDSVEGTYSGGGVWWASLVAGGSTSGPLTHDCATQLLLAWPSS